MAKNKIEGAIRHEGQVYVAGQEEALKAATGGKPVRGFGVDSTEPRGRTTAPGMARKAELEARMQQAIAEANGNGVAGVEGGNTSGAEGEVDPTSVTLAELPGVLAGITDSKLLQKYARSDKRAGAKDAYAARKAEIKEEEQGTREGTEVGEATGEDEGEE